MEVIYAFALGGVFGIFIMAIMTANKWDEVFREGTEHAKSRIINNLMDYKVTVNGTCHAHIAEIIKMVEDF